VARELRASIGRGGNNIGARGQQQHVIKRERLRHRKVNHAIGLVLEGLSIGYCSSFKFRVSSFKKAVSSFGFQVSSPLSRRLRHQADECTLPLDMMLVPFMRSSWACEEASEFGSKELTGANFSEGGSCAGIASGTTTLWVSGSAL